MLNIFTLEAGRLAGLPLDAFDAADAAFTAVTGDPAEAIICFVDTGTAATSRLVSFVDTGVTNLPVTPNGGDINVSIPAGLVSI